MSVETDTLSVVTDKWRAAARALPAAGRTRLALAPLLADYAGFAAAGA